MKLLKNRKGYTLVELIAASAALCVIIAITGGIMLASLRTYNKNTRLGEAKQLGISAYEYISGSLTYAVGIEIGGNESGYPESIKVESGRLLRSAGGGEFTEVYGDASYNGARLRTKTSVDGTVMSLTVEIIKDEDVLFSKSSSFSLLNIESAPGARLSGTTEEAADPQISFERE